MRAANVSTGYRLLDHTADAGLQAWGKSPAEAFAQAALGMFEIVLGGDSSRALANATAADQQIEVVGHDWESLLVNWLATLVYYFDVEGFVPVRFSFDACSPPRCDVRAEGALVNDPEQIAGVLIKAITYHLLEVGVRPERTELQVIFDI
jgi:SHS2 domain-containing protein